MNRRCFLLAGLAAVTLAAAPPPPSDDLETSRERFLAAVNAARQGEGLVPLRRNALLDGAAQTHADDMAVKGYFALTSPEGVDIDVWVDAAGYPARIVAEKLMSDATAPADFAVASRLDPAASRASLFHPEVTELGVGFAFSASTRQWLYSFVMARRQMAASAAAAGGAPEAPLAVLRERFLAGLNHHRRSSSLPSLVEEGALATAAQAHATELLRARRRGGSRDHLQQLVAPLAERVSAERRGTAASSIRGGSVIWQRPPGTVRGQAGAVGEAVVLDATDHEQALAAALESPMAHQLRDPHHLRFGLGVAVAPADRSGEAPLSVWVACTAPPPR